MGLFRRLSASRTEAHYFDQLSVPGYPQVQMPSGGGGWAYGWYGRGDAMINIYRKSYYSDNPRGIERIPYAYGESGVHEVIHLSAKGGLGYDERELNKAARSLEPNGSFIDWDGALKTHCVPPEFR